MKRQMLALILFLLAAAPLRALAQDEQGAWTPDQDLLPTGPALRYDYVRRESAAEQENYHRLRFTLETENRWFNPRAGLELRMDDSQVRCYFIGNDLRVAERTVVHLRLNHTEYADWETSINYFNAYISYKLWWFRFAVGIGYAALNFDPENYHSPLDFSTQTPETRFIYNLSLHPPLWKDLVELDLGLQNHNDFEYNGFDDTGYHVELLVNLGDRTTVSALYERRYSSFFISLPTLTRETWIISLEQRF
jgi:hypothetical protein